MLSRISNVNYVLKSKEMIVVSKFLRIFAPQSSDWVSLRTGCGFKRKNFYYCRLRYNRSRIFRVDLQGASQLPVFVTITRLKNQLDCHSDLI